MCPGSQLFKRKIQRLLRSFDRKHSLLLEVMTSLQNWKRGFLWMVCFCCLPLFFLASSLPLKGKDAFANHSCRLKKTSFQQFYFRNQTYTLARMARLADNDTDNRFVGQHLYINIKEKNHCYLMKRVTEIVVKNVLSELKNQYPMAEEVANFLGHLHTELSNCKPLGHKELVERNLEKMKDKMKQLGENGKNKAVGELDLLFDYLENSCTEGN
ncbi:interleukin-22 [Sphaerodactylus townsendi]|uniref:interleukin-22 n=1 Tax=Sphaerodactylus townsendi TaxID=933632 RepID=UPI0020263C7A|nr:interleukin-22 [Sphaerodactylus townsendi]